MKKLYYLGFVALFGVAVFAPSYASAIDSNADTTGNASFSNGSLDDITIVKPGTKEDEILPEKSFNNGKTVGVEDMAKLSYAPDFNFGNNKITLANKTKEYSVHNDLYAYTNKKNEKIEIPQFVQVADASGKLGTKWRVTAEQKEYFTSADGKSKLNNSRIRFYGQTTTNNLRTPEDTITGLTIGNSGYTELPVKIATEAPINVLSAKVSTPVTDASSTNGTKSSVVFAKNYNEANFKKVTTNTAVDSRQKNEDVKLAVPESETLLIQNYSAAINWQLTIEP